MDEYFVDDVKEKVPRAADADAFAAELKPPSAGRATINREYVPPDGVHVTRG